MTSTLKGIKGLTPVSSGRAAGGIQEDYQSALLPHKTNATFGSHAGCRIKGKPTISKEGWTSCVNLAVFISTERRRCD